MTNSEQESSQKNPFKEIFQPFVDVIRAPRALWGINLGYALEGMVYFGILNYLALHFSDFVFQGVPNPNEWAHDMVGLLTAGITISMFFLGFIADKKGVRFALLLAFFLMLIGRVFIAGAPTLLGLSPKGVFSSLHLVTMFGIVIVVVGYGMYQPAAYAAVRQFTTPKNSAMGYAMLYALMNLGGFLPTFAFLLRDKDYLNMGIPGVFWVYTGCTALALITTYLLLSPKTVEQAIAEAKQESPSDKKKEEANHAIQEAKKIPVHMVISMALAPGIFLWKHLVIWAIVSIGLLVLLIIPGKIGASLKRFFANHPLSDGKFFFFIFALIPVQTLFTYNWLVLPQYISRSYEGWIGEKFEIASNLNPILIFILVPMITALTRKAPVYRMMILGTTVMAFPAFLLAIGPYPWTLFTYIIIMTIGEAMWQPRFLQYAAEIAPEGRTGEYMGVAQFPWFLTKMIVPLVYSGWMMDKFCPADGPKNTEGMWLIYGFIAITSPIILIVAKKWMGKSLEV